MEKRAYGFVPYNISGRQAGIQFGHAKDEYNIAYGQDDMYLDWLNNWKTYVILNGGTSNLGNKEFGDYGIGSMEKYEQTLRNRGVKYAVFHEPDLNWMTSGIFFLVDERVFNTKLYPDFELKLGSTDRFGNTREQKIYDIATDTFCDIVFESEDEKEAYGKWVNDVIGGRENLFLRYFLRSFELAKN